MSLPLKCLRFEKLLEERPSVAIYVRELSIDGNDRICGWMTRSLPQILLQLDKVERLTLKWQGNGNEGKYQAKLAFLFSAGQYPLLIQRSIPTE
ncbi:hypothetical protein AcV5_003049 [Taiwanofungus camphoratus]|nr:hypothetical protein AcV5_003049 [Antrodia cinnamomea]